MKKGKLKRDGTPSKQGEGGGRPPKYNTDVELYNAVVAYLKDCEEKKKIPNKAGLMLWLDIDRPTYMAYKKKFFNAKRLAELSIESAWVNRLTETGATGAIFYLKNAFKDDYKDRTETDITSGGKVIPILGGIAKKK